MVVLPKTGVAMIDELLDFFLERYLIEQRRRQGLPWPWTDWPELREFRWCNSFREQDRGSVWLQDNWILPHADDFDLVFAVAVYRLGCNLPETAELIGYPCPWRPERYLEALSSCGKKALSKAYTLPIPPKGVLRFPYLVELLSSYWERREELRAVLTPGQTLRQAHELLCTFPEMSDFRSAQILADLKQIPPLAQASDVWTFCAVGPGSARGMSRMRGYPKNKSWNEAAWRRRLEQLGVIFRKVLLATNGYLPIPDNQNLNNILCEFDKLQRIRNGEKHNLRRYYPGAKHFDGEPDDARKTRKPCKMVAAS
jgi:hypothetical protein